MPIQQIAPADMHYVVDDFTDPWRKSDGNPDDSATMKRRRLVLVPQTCAARYKIVRPDMRGFGHRPRCAQFSMDARYRDPRLSCADGRLASSAFISSAPKSAA
jgi:hypothetical protein